MSREENKTCINVLLGPLVDGMKQIEESGYKFSDILEMDELINARKFNIVYMHIFTLIFRSKLNGRNNSEAINSTTVLLHRHGVEIINLTAGELNRIDRKTRLLFNKCAYITDAYAVGMLQR